WDADDLTGSLSFGYQALSGNSTFQKQVAVRNYSRSPHTYRISPQFRYADDVANGAVRLDVPPSIFVPANSTRGFAVTLNVNASKLPSWNLNGGSLGGAGPLLQGVEFDGYLTLPDNTENVHLAWHIRPHRAVELDPH